MMHIAYKPLTILPHALLILIALHSSSIFAITAPSQETLLHRDEQAESLFQQAFAQENRKNFSKAIRLYQQAAKKDHPTSQQRLANLYYYNKKDYKNAAYWYEKLAQQGHSDAQFHFANIYRFGLNGETKYDVARYWYKRASNGEHKHAQYELALMHQKGLGSKADQKTAMQWFTKAANNGHAEAKSVVKRYKANMQTKSANDAFVRKQQKLAAQNNPNAQYALGKAYLDGIKIKKNEQLALNWITKAANNNHANAQYTLAMFYFEGTSFVEKNSQLAKEWLIKAADNHNEHADKQLTALANEKWQTEQSASFENMLEAAINGSVEDQYELGMRYLIGYNTVPDEQLAIHWIREAALHNHAQAQYQLGSYLLKHQKSIDDMEVAVEFLVRAAKQNVRAARSAVKKFYEFGYANLIDANYGDANAQYKIAETYLADSDKNVKQHSMKWLELAVRHKHIPAMLTLGGLYERGEIVAKNLEQAFNLYLEAAKLNRTAAQANLNALLEQGIGDEDTRRVAFQIISTTPTQSETNLQFSEVQ